MDRTSLFCSFYDTRVFYLSFDVLFVTLLVERKIASSCKGISKAKRTGGSFVREDTRISITSLALFVAQNRQCDLSCGNGHDCFFASLRFPNLRGLMRSSKKENVRARDLLFGRSRCVETCQVSTEHVHIRVCMLAICTPLHVHLQVRSTNKNRQCDLSCRRERSRFDSFD